MPRLICPFCRKEVEGTLPLDCTRCEGTDGPGTGTPMVAAGVCEFCNDTGYLYGGERCDACEPWVPKETT